MAYNILAIIKGALASVHGVETMEETVSDFYVVDELQGVYRGMMIAIPPKHWQSFQNLSESFLNRDGCTTQSSRQHGKSEAVSKTTS